MFEIHSNTNQIYRLLVVVGVAIALFFNVQAYAVPSFLEKWTLKYPNSHSSDRGCQLCHAFPHGGDPWNAYGIAVRYYYQEIYGFDNIELAIADVENVNSDGDANGLTNLQEINLNMDPGWRLGNHNVHVYKNGDVIRNQPAPFENVDGTGSLCFPVLSRLDNAAVICL